MAEKVGTFTIFKMGLMKSGSMRYMILEIDQFDNVITVIDFWQEVIKSVYR